jgi:hypothetical protein
LKNFDDKEESCNICSHGEWFHSDIEFELKEEKAIGKVRRLEEKRQEMA